MVYQIPKLYVTQTWKYVTIANPIHYGEDLDVKFLYKRLVFGPKQNNTEITILKIRNSVMKTMQLYKNWELL